MTKEIVEAIGVLEREKGISADRLMEALEDALLSAYKKTPGSAKYARVDMDRGQRRLQRLRADPAARARGAAARRGRGGAGRGRRWTRRRASCASPRSRRSTRSGWPQYKRPDRRARRDARRLRAHRRPDGQAGDPPAHPRGRAGHDVPRVPGPRRRADHRHRPAVRLALHARPAARARRGAAAALRAGARRALRPRRARQGHHHRRLVAGEGAEHHRLAPLAGADPRAVRARGAGDRRRPGRDPERGPRARLPLEDRRGLARLRASTPWAPAWARAARACAWSCPSCAARRSTSSRSTRSRPASSPRRSRPRACARCSWTTRASRPR